MFSMSDLTSFENLLDPTEGKMILKKRMAELLKALTQDFKSSVGADRLGKCNWDQTVGAFWILES